jgi:uncharacterized protein
MNRISYSLRELVAKQKQELLQLQQRPYVPREREGGLREYLLSPLIKVVIGPRRAGKSRLIQKVLEKEDAAYLNFEEEQFKISNGDNIIDAAHSIYPHARYWYLDEIQDFPQWETLLNKLHRRGYNLVVTGSNAKLLSSELATALTGRHLWRVSQSRAATTLLAKF